MAQASQRVAGGAYMTGHSPTGQVFELSEAELNKAGFRDSVESVDSYHDKGHSRAGSSNSVDGSGKTPEGGSPVEGTHVALTVPQSSSSGQQKRNGRSPLARVSLIRTHSNDGNDIELEDRRQPSQSPSRGFSQPYGSSPSKLITSQRRPT